MSKNAEVREKHGWAIEKPKLDNDRRLRGIFFIDLEDTKFKEISKNARIKLETPMSAAMPCNFFYKSKYGKPAAIVSWKPVNSQECVWRNLYHIIMRTILQEEERIHHNITIWFTNLFPCLKL